MATSTLSNYADDYMNIRTLPGLLSVVFVVAGLYQFGAIGTLTFEWVNYTIATEHTVLASLGAYALAFASSETKRFEYYELWEQVLIVAGPAVILGVQYVPQIHDFLLSLGDPLGMQIGFLLTLASWGAAIQ